MIENLSEDIRLSVIKPSKCSPYIEVKLNTPLEDYDFLDLLGQCSKCPGIKILQHGIADFLSAVVGINVIFPDAPVLICNSCGNRNTPPYTSMQLCRTVEFVVDKLKPLRGRCSIESFDQICQLLKVG